MNNIRANLMKAVPLFAVLALVIAPAAAFAQSAAGCSPSNSGVYFADVTGDGKVDAIVVNKTGIIVRRSDGTQFLENEVWSNVPFYGSDPSGNAYVFFADVDGDGRADAIAVNPNGITVRRSDGKRFRENEDWTREGYFGVDQFGRLNVHFADATGGHKADAIVVNKDGVTVRRSDGGKFRRNERWTNEPYYGERGTYFADVDGDGKADAIVVNRNGITVRRSDGTRFLPNETWTNEGYHRERTSSRYYFADVDGDGRADLIIVGPDGIIVRLSDGTQFGPPMRWTRRAFIGGLGTYFFDVDGDGKADAIAVNTNGVTVRRSNGTEFTRNEAWTVNPFFGEIGPICSSGR
ncbi:MAG: VCBS repeat-containing protein [Acidobacteriia bacterium]|nr:VCBS repeat-containing protein [Terriglobia bacterium]